MDVLVVRRWFTNQATEGELSISDLFWCFTLEDRVRRPSEPKVAGRTAIPPGRYSLVWRDSPRFQRRMLTLLDVPEFTGILIHAGNRAEETAGCILVGFQRTDPTDDWIGQSTSALAALEGIVVPRLQSGEAGFCWVQEVPQIDTRTAYAQAAPQ